MASQFWRCSRVLDGWASNLQLVWFAGCWPSRVAPGNEAATDSRVEPTMRSLSSRNPHTSGHNASLKARKFRLTDLSTSHLSIGQPLINWCGWKGKWLFLVEQDWLLVNACGTIVRSVIPSSIVVGVNIMIEEIVGLKNCFFSKFG